ncbi:hypothetical protein QEN19_000455 [Hanseniaspora menglaensis]
MEVSMDSSASLSSKSQKYRSLTTEISPADFQLKTEIYETSVKQQVINGFKFWKELNIRLKVLTAVSVLVILVNLFIFILNCISANQKWSFEHEKLPIVTDINFGNYETYLRPLSFLNATFLFNSVNSFLKQKDSDIFPVGLSFVPATIPKDTFVYHFGKGFPDGFEWLAMDVEFSLSFGDRERIAERGTALVNKAKKNRDRANEPGQENGYPPPLSSDGENGSSYYPNDAAKRDDKVIDSIDYCVPYDDSNNQRGPFDRDDKKKNGEPSTLMTFKLKHDLKKLIYLDGASASKADSTGEMDTQKILYNQIKKHYPNLPEGSEGFMKERDYADMICKWGALYGVEGYVRLELGFEVVLCDFGEHLDLVSNTTITSVNEMFDLDEPVNITSANGWPINCTDGTLMIDKLTTEQSEVLALEDMRFKQLKSFGALNSWEQVRIAGHSHDTGEKRIDLDYRYLVTAINATELDKDNYKWKIVFENSDPFEKLLFNQLDDVVKKHKEFDAKQSTNWQQKTEQIQTKFTPFLKNIQSVLNDENLSLGKKAMKLSHFTHSILARYETENGIKVNSSSLAQMAVWEYSYPTSFIYTDADKLIFTSLTKVMNEIIMMLIDVKRIAVPIANEYLKTGSEIINADEEEFVQIAEKVNDLISNLNWVSFGYECSKKCEMNEICFTPSWGPSPVGWVAIKDDDNRRGNSNNDLPIGFEKDQKSGFNRVKNAQECIGLEFFINRNSGY